MSNKIAIFSFFSGVGILDLAFEKNDFEVVFVNEFDELFLESYKFARSEMHLKEPIYGYDSNSAERYTRRRGKRKLIKWVGNERKKGNLVGFIGGPPCPDFSVAGKNNGCTGQNGRLTKTYFNLICRCKPDFFIFENVKGLVKTQKHKSFYNEMKQKAKANNYIISDALLNALDYGVPQFRERIFMVGVSASLLFNSKHLIDVDGQLKFDWAKYKKYDSTEILQRKWPTITKFGADTPCDFKFAVPKKLTVQYWFTKNCVETHPNECDVFSVKKGQQKIQTIGEGDTKGKSFKRLHRWRFSPTAAYGHNEVHLHPYKERRISVAEAMAIQSLPKEFILPKNAPLSSKFKMIGNGVPFLMAQAIARALADFLNNLREELS